MRRRDVPKALLASAAVGSALASKSADAQTCSPPCYPRTPIEVALGITPVNYSYMPGEVYRYGTNTNPGATDMEPALNTCAKVCRAGGYTLVLPAESCLVTKSLDFSQISVRGPNCGGYPDEPHIIGATGNDYIIKSSGNSTFENFYVNGNWDGSIWPVDDPLTGPGPDIFHFAATGPDDNADHVAYNIHLRNVRMKNAKRCSIYWFRAGYSSVSSCASNGSGLHGVALIGDKGVQSTTVTFDGSCTFSDTHGYGMLLRECVSIALNGVIMENTHGILLEGIDNRAFTFNDIYQEGTAGGKFITSSGSSGIGLTMIGCFGAVIGMDDLSTWNDVHIFGNAAIAIPAIPLAGRVSEAISQELTTAVSGSVTAVALPLSVGTWKVNGEVQIADAGGLSSTLVLGSRLTTNAGDSGLANQTNGNFEIGADTSGAARSSDRSKTYKIMRLTAPATVYLRAYFGFASGTLAYKGHLYAELLQ